MATVSFKKVVKKFDENEILHGIDLDVEEHEFLVLVGPSGCGKSTLLRLVAGLEEITSGDIFIGDTLINHLPPRDRAVSMVFQDYALYPHMSVRENMSFGLRLRKYSSEEIKKRVGDAANILQINDLLDRKPRQLSGGQRQRVAIGRSIVRKPQVFLFDEPLSNLDAKLRGEMRIELSRLHRKLNNTIIYVTHDQIEAMTLGTRIAVMKNGYIQQTGAPAEVYKKPANTFVAGFIGSPTMNFIEGTLEKSSGYVYFKNETMRIMIPDKHVPRVGDINDKPVIMGIRPEDIFIDRINKNLSNEISVTLDVTELLGHKMNLYLISGKNRLLATVEASFKQEPGCTIPLWFNSDNIHLFDKTSGGRLK